MLALQSWYLNVRKVELHWSSRTSAKFEVDLKHSVFHRVEPTQIFSRQTPLVMRERSQRRRFSSSFESWRLFRLMSRYEARRKSMENKYFVINLDSAITISRDMQVFKIPEAS